MFKIVSDLFYAVCAVFVLANVNLAGMIGALDDVFSMDSGARFGGALVIGVLLLLACRGLYGAFRSGKNVLRIAECSRKVF